MMISISKNDRNDGIGQSRILKSLAEYVHCRVCFVNVQLSLHENVVFSVCVRMDTAAYIIFFMWNHFSGLDAWYHSQLWSGCHGEKSSKKYSGNFLRGGEGGQFLRSSSFLCHLHF